MSTAVISSAPPARVHKLAATQFDYNTVPASIRFDLQAQAKLIKKLIAKTTADLIDLGRHLIAAKQHIGHGLFIPWVEGEIGISGRTAQRYMAIAQLAEAKNDSVSLLPPTILHRLAAPSAPLEVVDYVIGQANDGVIVQDSVVAMMIADARRSQTQAKKSVSPETPTPEKRASGLPRGSVSTKNDRRKLMAEEISRFAYKLIQLDIALARELNRLLWADHTFVADRLMSDLEYGIEIEAGGTPNKDGLDIPDYLKRDAKAGAA
jgi:Protein of unknown function (DUF3102)